MTCPVCQSSDTRTIDSRPGDDGVRRRRRACNACEARWSTFEAVIEGSVLVGGPAPSEQKPEWWSEARKLDRQGIPRKEIARLLGRSPNTVSYALNPKFRKAVKRNAKRHRDAPGVSEVANMKRQIKRRQRREQAEARP